MKSKQNFNEIVNLIVTNEELQSIKPVIEKELLHYEILLVLEKEGFLNEIVFHGGTSLRLCYGSTRFSEDLDFAGGSDFTKQKFNGISNCICQHFLEKFGFDVKVKEPTKAHKDYDKINVDTWSVSISISPSRPDLPLQKIKIDIASMTALTRPLRTIKRNYDFLPDGVEDILIPTMTIDELLANKLISLPASIIRNRDIWDIAWLERKGATLNHEFIKSKIAEFNLKDYEERAKKLISILSNHIRGEMFNNEMKRFIPKSNFDKTLAREEYLIYLEEKLKELFTCVLEKL